MANDNDQLTPEEALLSRKWKHRRRLAYIALIGAIGVTLVLIGVGVSGTAGMLPEFNSVLVTAVGGMISLTGAYMGLATWRGD